MSKKPDPKKQQEELKKKEAEDKKKQEEEKKAVPQGKNAQQTLDPKNQKPGQQSAQKDKNGKPIQVQASTFLTDPKHDPKNEEEMRLRQEEEERLEREEEERKRLEEEQKQRKRQEQAVIFEKYLEDSGLSLAFQIVMAEVISKRIPEDQIFQYTALRLRQIGQEMDQIERKAEEQAKRLQEEQERQKNIQNTLPITSGKNAPATNANNKNAPPGKPGQQQQQQPAGKQGQQPPQTQQKQQPPQPAAKQPPAKR